MVKQQIKSLGVKYEARIDYELLQNMFYRRLSDERIKICKALEAEFDDAENSEEREIQKLIQAYRKVKLKELELDLEKQEKRLKAAEEALALKETKKFLNEKRIATNHIEKNTARIKGMKRSELIPTDSRVFPMTYAPIIVRENDENVIKLARYHCRPADKPESIDIKYNGLYNARRDNLGNAFWRDLFGHKHGFFVVQSFYENVSSLDYKVASATRPQASSSAAIPPEDKNLIVQFTPKGNHDLKIACLYDLWGTSPEDSFYSFAALTHEPTPEISQTGHDRLIIALKDENLEPWLSPEQMTKVELEAILDDPEHHIYEHVLS
ncbi:SOS response-associated peptidase family protein [Bdellovibrio sp. NC01]|uniref:SOS response-associated peptidase family protein n=1 Tax=Bdellovibrio sp. NC01 TaxID=2220073 RepID=UPI00143DFA7B|nr:SOS response-associated peptidase family protein [Bdellovibrio sp. NC01]